MTMTFLLHTPIRVSGSFSAPRIAECRTLPRRTCAPELSRSESADFRRLGGLKRASGQTSEIGRGFGCASQRRGVSAFPGGNRSRWLNILEAATERHDSTRFDGGAREDIDSDRSL